MQRYTMQPYTRLRGLFAYLHGMMEFRSDFTTKYFSYSMRYAYDSGRDMAHRLTFRHYEHHLED